MQTYVALARHTAEARRDIEDVPEWHEHMREVVASMDGRVREAYHGSVGGYDAVVVLDLPDDRSGERVRLLLERDGTHEVEVAEAFEHDEYEELVRELP